MEITATNTAELRSAGVRGLAFAVGFFFSFRLVVVLLSVHLLTVEPAAGSALGLALNLVVVCIVCFSTVGTGERTIGSMLRLWPVRWVFAFLAFSGLSLAWSETASLPTSLAYWMNLTLDMANVTLLLRCGTGSDESHSLLKGFIWSTCCLAAIAWIMPTAPDLRLGDEQFFNTNEIGNVCAFAIFFAQYLTRCKEGEWHFAKGFLAITLIRSLSKTTLAAFLIGETLLLMLDGSMSRKAKLTLLICALVLLIVFWGLFSAYYDYYTTNGNQAETLTGRIVVWLYVLNGVSDHPWTLWIGHGFDSWWKVVPPFGGELFEARHAENELLQQLYAYGVVGVVLLAGLYFSLFRQLRKLRRSPGKIVLLCFLAFIVVRGLAESDAFDLLLPLWTIALLSVSSDSEPETGESSPARLSLESGPPSVPLSDVAALRLRKRKT